MMAEAQSPSWCQAVTAGAQEHMSDDQSARLTASVRAAEPGVALIPCREDRERRRRMIKSVITKRGLQSI